MLFVLGLILVCVGALHQIAIPFGYGVLSEVGLFGIPGDVFWMQFSTVVITVGSALIYKGWFKAKAQAVDEKFSKMEGLS